MPLMDFFIFKVKGGSAETNFPGLGGIILLDNRFSADSYLKAFEVLAFNFSEATHPDGAPLTPSSSRKHAGLKTPRSGRGATIYNMGWNLYY